MKRYSIHTALLVAALASCTNQFSNAPDQVAAPLCFTAQMGDSDATKTMLAENGTSVLWQPSDDINAFYGETRIGRYTNNSREAVSVAVFEGDGKSFIGATEEEGTKKNYWAVYPYNFRNTSDGKSVTAPIPDFQVATAGNFAKGSLFTVARSETTVLQFYHVCGGIKFTVTHPGIRQVELKGNNNEVLAGLATVTMDEKGRPVITSIDDPQRTVKLTARGGQTFQIGEWYYIVCAPVVFSQGFTLTLRSETETGVYVFSDPIEVKRAVWGTLSSVDDATDYQAAINAIECPAPNEIRYISTSGNPIEITIQVDDQDNLLIEDNFIMDGICHLILNRGITEIHRLQGNSYSNNGLKTVILPEGIKKIGSGAFMYLRTLISVSLPASLSDLAENCFSQTGLSSITLPEGLTTIPNGAFSTCHDLQVVNLPSSIESIGGSAFSSCSIRSILLPDSCKRIGEGAFASNPLKEITIPKDCEVAYEAFRDCKDLSRFNSNNASADGRCLLEGTTLVAFAPKGLTSYEIPESVTKLSPELFTYSSSLNELIIPNSVVSMAGYITLSNSSGRLIVKCDNPPSFFDTDSYVPGFRCSMICVPAGSVDIYKNAPVWEDYADIIQAIP